MRRILYQTFDGGNHRRVGMPDRRNDLVRRPAAAKRLIERHEAVARKPDDLGTLLFQGELLPFRIENVEEIGQTAVVALGRHLCRLARRLQREIEAAQALPITAIGSVGFVNLLHRRKNGLLIGRCKLVRPEVGNLDLGIECAEVEDRGTDRRPHRPNPGDGNRRTRSWASLRTRPGGEQQAREQVRGSGSDIGDRSRQEPLGFENIGASSQEIDGKPERRPGRQPRDRSRAPQVAGDRLRIFSHQNSDRVAVGRDQCLERLDVCLQRLNLTPREQHIKFVGQAAIQASLGQIEHLTRGLDVAIKNLKALLAGPQIEIQTGDVGGDHDIDPVARLLERFGGIDLRFETARDLAENVDLPFGVETADPVDAFEIGSVVPGRQRLRGPALGLVLPGAGAAPDPAIDLRERQAADHDELQPRLLQTVERNLEIEVVLYRAVDQVVQLRVPQRPPPLPQIGTRAAGRRFLARRRRHEIDGKSGVRREIFRADGTACQRTGKHDRTRETSYSHAPIPDNRR